MTTSVSMAPTAPLDTLTLEIQGMKCAGCVQAVERILLRQPGVEKAAVNLITAVAVVQCDRQQCEPTALIEATTKGGFPSHLRQEDSLTLGELAQQNHHRRQNEERAQLWRLGVATVLLLLSSVAHVQHHGQFSLPGFDAMGFHWFLATLALVIPGGQLIRDGFLSLWRGQGNMNSLVMLGTVSAYGTSTVAWWWPALEWECFFDEPVMLLGFIFLGRTLEGRARMNATSALEKLLSLQPAIAHYCPDRGPGESWDLPIGQVKTGDWLQVRPGEKFPVDGVIRWGKTTVDEAMLTGESAAITKQLESQVKAGTVNLQGLVIMEATHTGPHTLLAQIINRVEQAQTQKAPMQQVADRVAGYFAYGVMVLAAIAFCFWFFAGPLLFPPLFLTTPPLLWGIKLAIAVLVVACPCALGLATPMAILVGTGMGAQQGLVFKGGDALEMLSKIQTFVFDKTGTLTTGNPQFVALENHSPHSDRQLIQWASTLEQASNHPLAIALKHHSQTLGIAPEPLEQGEVIPGSGVRGTIHGQTYYLGQAAWIQHQGFSLPSPPAAPHTTVYFASDRQLLGVFYFRDTLRPEAQTLLQTLKTQGKTLILLTGDRATVAQALTEDLPFDHIHSEISPEAKAQIILQEQEKQQGAVAMVGDGINDAPALAQADLGISLQGATDIALDSAGLVLMQPRLDKLLEAIALSGHTVRKIKQNLWWALGYNLITLPLAAGVLLPSLGVVFSPAKAGMLMASSSLIVVTNSLLLKRKTLHLSG